MYTSICWYLLVLPLLHVPDVIDIGVNTIICHKDYRLQPFLSIQYVHGDSCKHLGIDSSTNQMIGIRSELEAVPKCLHKSPCTY